MIVILDVVEPGPSIIRVGDSTLAQISPPITSNILIHDDFNMAFGKRKPSSLSTKDNEVSESSCSFAFKFRSKQVCHQPYKKTFLSLNYQDIF